MSLAHPPPQPALKRKRDDIPLGHVTDVDQRSFTLHIRQPDSTAPFDNPVHHTFTPLCLLPRASLPLSYLDTALDGSRQCVTTLPIRLLEAFVEGTECTGVLVAEEYLERKLYAIERIRHRVYALCRLAAWVTREAVKARSAWKTPDLPVKRLALQSVENKQPWWAQAAVDVPPHADEKLLHKLPKLSMVRKLAEITPLVADDPQPVNDLQLNEQPSVQNDGQPLTAHDHLQELAKNYLDALYLSRTSLAYFAKGPLSRTRATFSSNAAPTMRPSELVGFLREAILTSLTMDKKYREGIPSAIKELPATNTESPEKPPKKKKTRKWKPKRDKVGFFVDEKEHVELWWLADDVDDVSNLNETKEAAIKRRSNKLRTRETHLQIVFILEVLALELAIETQTNNVHSAALESDTLESQANEIQTDGEPKKPKAKKQQDLRALLETLIDRLCIWQSLEVSSPSKIDDKANGDSGSTDELRNFCVEIIIPFYMARIPKYATVANRKLGGPAAPTPVKRRASTSRKPGEPAVRQPPEKKPRRPLSRVFTDSFNPSTQPPPLLHRSATDTDVLSHVKQESGSDPPLASIPAKKSRRPIPTPRNHASLMRSMSNLSRREIDLDAMSAANEVKIRKKADADAKLREALAMIKKPNRTLAHKEVAENADLSFAKATAKNHRSAPAHHRVKPARPSASFDVEATPKHSRTIQATPARGRPEAQNDRIAMPSSGASMVPASTRLSPDHANLFAVPQSSYTSRHAAAGARSIHETPSRGFAKYMPVALVHEPGTLPESPVATRRAPNFLQQTPVKRMRSPSPVVAARHGTEMNVQATPLMKRLERPVSYSPENAIEASPEMVRRKPSLAKPKATTQESSLYAALGWDDNEYDDLT